MEELNVATYDNEESEDCSMEELLVATFDNEEPEDFFWRYVDHIINIAATARGIVIGIDKILCSINEFCRAHGITNIPPLYDMLLSDCGNLNCAYYICFYKDAWLKRFPNGLTYKKEMSDFGTLHTYRDYLTDRGLEYELKLVNLYLQRNNNQAVV